MIKYLVSALAVICISLHVGAQITILNTSINSYNVTPQSICQVNVMNYSEEIKVTLNAQLTNSAGEPILKVTSQPFVLKKGINSIAGNNLVLSSIEFGSSKQGSYIRESHALPSGKFNYCCMLKSFNTEAADDYCEDIEADQSAFLMLINPADKDTIETPNPLLIWMHSEPFNLLAANEYFKIIISELTHEQNAESGVTSNIPVYTKSYLTMHEVLYPFDARQLMKGKRYGWQIQKIANGVVINKSEAWEFVLGEEKIEEDNKYARLKKDLDPGYYYAANNKIFFVFDEEYKTESIECLILDSKQKVIKPKVLSDEEGSENADNKHFGYNRFCIDLNDLKIKNGFYTLVIKNSKNESLKLKFLVP